MKKLIVLLYLLLIGIAPNSIVFASNSYARITSDYAYLYLTASPEIEGNVICYLEASYFVEITLDYNSDFYKVNYNGISGYALKSDVNKVSGQPTRPFPEPIIVSSSSKCYLRSSPMISDDNIVTVIPSNCTDLKYIGQIYGKEAIDYQGNLWYMVSYYGVQGYIYSKYIASISPIAINTEIFDTQKNNNFSNPSPLNNMECAIIITGLSIPIILIVFIMYHKPKTIKRKITKKSKETSTDEDIDKLL